jgi:LL-diaminopimelate aminotransferase
MSLLPPYLYAELDRLEAQTRAGGVDIISFGVGDPDLPTPRHIIEAICDAAHDRANHRYPTYEGLLDFRQAAADWFHCRFGVAVDPRDEVLTLIGAKEGIGHLFWALVEPGDLVLVPDPSYPVYRAQVALAGGTIQPLPLRAEHDFIPDLDALEPAKAERARLLVLNFPNNPTGASATLDFYRRAVEFGLRHRCLVVNDCVYSELYLDGHPPPSLLQAEGAKEVAVEFHSLSKTYNMTGWRLGFAVGDRRILRSLRAVKTNCDSGVPQAIQRGGIVALRGNQESVEELRRLYRRRRDLAVDAFGRAGWPLRPSPATFYIWAEVPAGETSSSWATRLLREAGILVTPGQGFGEYGEGYVRLALTLGEERIVEAAQRLERAGLISSHAT